jgi:hypothetical protein
MYFISNNKYILYTVLYLTHSHIHGETLGLHGFVLH